MRHIREIENLPINKLSDQEIVKAALFRLKSAAVLMVYEDNGQLVFIGQYSNSKNGNKYITWMKRAWEDKFGKFKSINENV